MVNCKRMLSGASPPTPCINNLRSGYPSSNPQGSFSQYRALYRPTASANTTAPMASPKPAVFISALPWLAPVATAPVPLAAATCNPYAVVGTAVPFTVAVPILVDVVLAVQPDQVVHGAFVLHGPAVQPGQSEGGHALPPHHAVHGPERQSVLVDQSLQGP